MTIERVVQILEVKLIYWLSGDEGDNNRCTSLSGATSKSNQNETHVYILKWNYLKLCDFSAKIFSLYFHDCTCIYISRK